MPISIQKNEVHVWTMNLDRPAIDVERYCALLSADERVRARRFCFVEHANRYTVARANLRRILSRYTDTAPEALRFEYAVNGKPFFATGPIRFNLSHSSDVAALAITRDREIGIDVEKIRRDHDLLDVAEHYFAPQERSALRLLSAEERYFGFFRCWTRKEAYIKARGDGMSLDLQGFSVSLGADEPPALIASAEGPGELKRWKFANLELHQGYAAALAVEGRVCELRWFEEQAA
jgi:4'-phosphopantetheinyl transferase